jgi:hypothetical protein
MLSRSTLVLSLIAMLCAVGIARNLYAQGDPIFEQGFKPFGSFQGGDIDTVNLLNGKIGLHIPLFSYPQRGGVLNIDYHLDYAGPLFLNIETDCGGGAGHCFGYTDGYDNISDTGPT